jgi:hypothetical protein
MLLFEIQKKKARDLIVGLRETLPIPLELYVSAFSPTVCMQVHIHMGMLCVVRERSPFVGSVVVIFDQSSVTSRTGESGARDGI